MPSVLGSVSLIQYLPSGSIVDFGGTSAPSGWIMCDGTAISRSVYQTLFSSIGINYGSGDGSTTFNLPDFRGRFARYNDDMGTIAGSASRDSGRILGTAQTQATAVNGLSIGSTDPSHSHYARQLSGATLNPNSGGGNTAWCAVAAVTNDSSHTTSGATPSVSHAHSVSSSNTETRPINLSCNRIIKY